MNVCNKDILLDMANIANIRMNTIVMSDGPYHYCIYHPIFQTGKRFLFLRFDPSNDILTIPLYFDE